MARQSPRAAIRDRVYGQLRSQLNSRGMNVTDDRVDNVLDTLGDKYGYYFVKQADISREVRKYADSLERE